MKDIVPLERSSPMPAVVKALRIPHWIKNVLLVVPLVVAHEWHQLEAVAVLTLAIFCFCMVASSGYVVNDLLDREADRFHPTKHKRPFARGDLRLRHGILLALVLFVTGLCLALAFLPRHVTYLLLAYLLISLLYSTYCKHRIVLDVITLAGLYTIRIFAGGASVGITVSAWLLAFSMFLFLSLAFSKRYTELAMPGTVEKGATNFRPYKTRDLEVFRSVGPASGLLSVLVLAFYVNSEAVRVLYTTPEALWLLCPLLLYWILRIWFLTVRGETDFDPVVLALRDPTSYMIGMAASLVFLFASLYR